MEFVISRWVSKRLIRLIFTRFYRKSKPRYNYKPERIALPEAYKGQLFFFFFSFLDRCLSVPCKASTDGSKPFSLVRRHFFFLFRAKGIMPFLPANKSTYTGRRSMETHERAKIGQGETRKKLSRPLNLALANSNSTLPQDRHFSSPWANKNREVNKGVHQYCRQPWIFDNGGETRRTSFVLYSRRPFLCSSPTVRE